MGRVDYKFLIKIATAAACGIVVLTRPVLWEFGAATAGFLIATLLIDSRKNIFWSGLAVLGFYVCASVLVFSGLIFAFEFFNAKIGFVPLGYNPERESKITLVLSVILILIFDLAFDRRKAGIGRRK